MASSGSDVGVEVLEGVAEAVVVGTNVSEGTTADCTVEEGRAVSETAFVAGGLGSGAGPAGRKLLPSRTAPNKSSPITPAQARRCQVQVAATFCWRGFKRACSSSLY